MNKIFICIPIHNRLKYTLNCLESIYKSAYNNFKIILCDDGSTDESSQIIKTKYADIDFVYGNGTLFWTGGTEMAVQRALELGDEDDFIYTLNNDTEITVNTLSELLKLSKKFPDSIIGSLNVFFNDPAKIEPSSFIKRGGFILREAQKPVHKYGESIPLNKDYDFVDSLSGKGVLIPISIINKIGTFNYKLLPHYFGDSELTVRARNMGFRVILSYKSKVLSHVEETGPGTIKTKETVFSILKSYNNIKSENYIKSIYYRAKLVYGKFYLFYFLINVIHRIFVQFKYKFIGNLNE